MPTPNRRLTRRVAPPRPTYEGAPGAEMAAPLSRSVTDSRRASADVLRQAPYLMAELKRIAGVFSVCIGMLVLLAVVDRLR